MRLHSFLLFLQFRLFSSRVVLTRAPDIDRTMSLEKNRKAPKSPHTNSAPHISLANKNSQDSGDLPPFTRISPRFGMDASIIGADNDRESRRLPRRIYYTRSNVSESPVSVVAFAYLRSRSCERAEA